MINVTSLVYHNYFINLPIPLYKLSECDKRAANYCTQFIHGLTYSNESTDLNFSQALRLFQEIIGNTKTIIAYKCEDVIKTFLKNQILVNIEELGINDNWMSVLESYCHRIPKHILNCDRHQPDCLRCAKLKCYVLAHKLKEKHVTFSLNLERIYLVPHESYVSEWIIAARDRERFKNRILYLERIINPVLLKERRKLHFIHVISPTL